jgi:hypothetical protein
MKIKKKLMKKKQIKIALPKFLKRKQKELKIMKT